MKHALISPNEIVYDFAGLPLGQRVAQVSEIAFEISPPLFWVDCDDDTVAEEVFFDVEIDGIRPIPNLDVANSL